MDQPAATATPDSATPEVTPDAAIAGMLAALRVMAERFVESFGAPAALIKGGAIYGKARERILRWLHDMEAVVRRLLLLRAAMFPQPESPASVSARLVRASARRPPEGDAVALFGPSNDPSHWRVCFSMPAPLDPAFIYARAPAKTSKSSYVNGHRAEAAPDEGVRRTGPLAYWIDDPRPLAERFEALLRVIQDPDHYAARLAQRLYLWRGRMERRQIFLESLCAKAPIANEAGLEDSEWDFFAQARALALALLHVFGAAASGAAPALALLNST